MTLACPSNLPPGDPLNELDLLDTAILRIELDGSIGMLNTAAEQALQISRDRASGRTLAEMTRIPPELHRAMEQLPADGASLRVHELQLAGGMYDCTLRLNETGAVILELHDLAWERLRLRLHQRELQTGLLELLSRNLGHEIRNPLGGIRAAAQMLAAELAIPELAMLARLIMRESDRIEELIQSFGRPEMTRLPVDLYPLLDEATALLEIEFRGKAVIERDFDPSIPPLVGDAAAVRQVLLNLLRNAYQANARHIRLRTRVEHGGALLQDSATSLLRLDVVDDGEGVPESLRNLLFLPLVTGKRDGTGLGLALSQQIAAAHGGLLTYEAVSAGQGSGSRFSVYLPLHNTNTRHPAAAEVVA